MSSHRHVMSDVRPDLFYANHLPIAHRMSLPTLPVVIGLYFAGDTDVASRYKKVPYVPRMSRQTCVRMMHGFHTKNDLLAHTFLWMGTARHKASVVCSESKHAKWACTNLISRR